MAVLVLSGELLNVVARGTLSASPAVATGFTLADVKDRMPGTVYRPTSYAATTYLQVDLNQVTNPTFDTDLTGWTSGDAAGGASTRTTVGAEVRTGAGALKLAAGAGQASRSFDLEVGAGEKWTIDAYGAADPAGGQLRIRVFNPVTGNWLQSGGGSWAAAIANAALGPTGAGADTYAPAPVTFQVESYQACRSDKVTLRVELRCVTGTAFCDDFYMYPGVDFSSVHGHTIDPRWTVTLRSSTDAFAASDTAEATATVNQHGFFMRTSGGTTVYRRYWRLRLAFGGTAPAGTFAPTAVMIGEWILGQAKTLTIKPVHPQQTPWQRGERMPQVRGAALGANYVTNLLTRGIKWIRLPFISVTDAEDKELLWDIWRRSGSGLYPMVLVPVDTESDVYYGRAPGERMTPRVWEGASAAAVYEQDLEIIDEPGPSVGL